MNHTKHYELLINKAKNRTKLDGFYYEKHHIIPKSFGGSNKNDNIVYLTGREHFVAHMLLAKIYGGGMWQAAKMMRQARGNVQHRYFNSRLYEIAKKEWIKVVSGKKRPSHVIEKLIAARRIYVTSEETKAKMSASRKGKPRSGDPTKWKHSEEAKKKMSESRKNKPNHMLLDEHKERMKGENNPMKKEENRKKISEAKKLYWANKRKQSVGVVIPQ